MIFLLLGLLGTAFFNDSYASGLVGLFGTAFFNDSHASGLVWDSLF